MELLLIDKDARSNQVNNRIKTAKLLTHTEIILLFLHHDKENKKIIDELKEKKDITPALLAKDQNQARQLRRHYAAIFAPPRRDMIECKAVTHILNPEQQTRSDFIHHRNSGLNQVLLKLCKAHGKKVITTLSTLQTQPTIILGRMMQNANWCRKYKVPYHVTSGAKTLYEQRDADGLQALERELLNHN